MGKEFILENGINELFRFVKKQKNTQELKNRVEEYHEKYKKEIFDNFSNEESYNLLKLRKYINDELFGKISACFLLKG
ncbi:MAG: hypothetical protein FWG70_10900 [Oscillospiraceae bacterium]|nr:hypothetical protein [Oscillospiraceae bacterium]